MSINRVTLTGNLTRDPDLRATASGMPVLRFGIAVNDRRRNPQTDEWEDYPNFIDCTMFGKRAESVTKFLSKGIKVAVEGKLRWSQWIKDDEKRSKIEVIVDEIEFMASHKESKATSSADSDQSTASQTAEPYQSQMPGMPAPVVDASIYDTDIPF